MVFDKEGILPSQRLHPQIYYIAPAVQPTKGEFVMKIALKAVTAAGLLLGIGASIHTTAVLAQPDCSPCLEQEIECEEGNQSACYSWYNVCVPFCKERVTAAGAPPSKHNEKPDVALLNSKHTVTVAK
jgi:hypothetical protein